MHRAFHNIFSLRQSYAVPEGMDMQKTVTGNGLQKPLSYQGFWLLSFLAGASVGTLSARYSVSVMPDAAAELCALAGDRLSAPALLCSAAVFLVMLILLSQLPGGSVLVSLLTALKAMCMAYALGLFYQFRLTMELNTALFRISIHTALLLPACCSLACHCCAARTEEGRVLSLVLPFLYILMIALLEFLFWGAGLT